jgi:hypothetical protein
VGSSALRAVRWCLSSLWRGSGEGLPGALWVLALVPVVLAISGDGAAVEAEEYSPYADPAKPVLSVLLSDPQNVEEFRKEFDLTGSEVEEVRAAVRTENERLSKEYAESERIVESSKALSRDQIRSKIAASDYDETVTAAVAQTKKDIEALLPEDRRRDLKSWVDEQWGLEARDASTEGSAEVVRTTSRSSALRCKVFATQYIGYTRYEAALPHRALKFGSRPRVAIRRVAGGRVVRPRIKEVGPWNTYDNYWAAGANRTMWKNLPRCKPEAQAAYYSNYNNGRDEFGRKVLNPAGVDLTPAVARGMGLRKYQNAWVYVWFPWVRR